MNKYIQVTTRYLKVQKKRTALTVLGIILSVALITGIGTILESIQDKMVRDAEKESGSYHVMFGDISSDKVDLIRKHTGVTASGVRRDDGFTVIGKAEGQVNGDDSETKVYNRYLGIKACDEGAMSLLPMKLSEGRLPKADGELAIDSWVLSTLPGKPSIGDKVKLQMGVIKSKDGSSINCGDNFVPGTEAYEKTVQKEYMIVGLLKAGYYYSGLNMSSGVAFLDKSKLAQSEKYNVYIKVDDFKNAIERARQMSKDIELKKDGQQSGYVQTNERVLRLYGESVNQTLGDTFMILVTFIIIIVVVCMIAVIYNAFNISVLERVSQFGLLRCVGASSSQIRKIVLREALLLSAVGIPIGLFCGTAAMSILFSIIGKISPDLPFNDLNVVISPQIVIMSVLLGLIAVVLSAYGPAMHAARIAPMDALRNTGSYKKESFKKIKKSRMARVLFGTEGWIAWKNLRRNRKRFVITVLSMVISIVLYIVFNSIFSFAFKTEVVSDTKANDYMAYNNGSKAITKQELDSISAIPGIAQITKYRSRAINAVIPPEGFTKAYRELDRDTIKKADGRTILTNSSICSVGDNMLPKLKKGLVSGSLDAKKLNMENGVIILNTAVLSEKGTGKTSIQPVTGYKPGDELEIGVVDQNAKKGKAAEISKDIKLVKVKVTAVLETSAIAGEYNYGGGVTLFTTESNFQKLTGSNDIKSLYIDLKPEADRKAINKKFEELAKNNPELQYIDYSEMAEQQNSAMLIMEIFVYGFIAVITLIGSINIVNTISTNLILRTKELSMMKAIGMTKGAIKKMVCLESIFHGLIAAFIGGISGTLLSYLFYTYVARIRDFAWSIPWESIAIAGAGAVIVALLAGYIPLRRINNGVIIENIRAEE